MTMDDDSKRRIEERIASAKRELMDALRIAEGVAKQADVNAIGRLCGQLETLQHKFI